MSDLPDPTPPRPKRPAGAKKQPPNSAKAVDELPFESALEKLEAIVESLESGDVPLSDLLSRYEEASTLLKTCQQQLDAAQLRIERLSNKGDGPILEPFTPEA